MVEPSANTSAEEAGAECEVSDAGATNVAGQPFDELDLRAIYQAVTDNRIDLRKRIWDTMRTAGLLCTGSLAGIGGIAASEATQRQAYIALGTTLIVVGIYLAFWVFRNVRREQGLLYHDEYALFQIERLLGLHRPIPERHRWLPRARHLFGNRHLDHEFRCTPKHGADDDPVNDWVEGRLASQAFLHDIVFGFSGILVLPTLGVGLLLITLGIGAVLE